MSVQSALGSSLVLYYESQYNVLTGNWTPEVGTTVANQATSGARPGMMFTPAGNAIPFFDGTNDTLAGPFTELGSLPAPSTGQRMAFFSFYTNGTARQYALNFNAEAYGVNILNDGDMRFSVSTSSGATARSDANIVPGIYYRVIVIGDEASKVVTLYINGVPQATTATFSSTAYGAPGEWGASAARVASYAGTTGYLNGRLGSLGFAYKASAFTTTEIGDLDVAMAQYLSGPAGWVYGNAALTVTQYGRLQGYSPQTPGYSQFHYLREHGLDRDDLWVGAESAPTRVAEYEYFGENGFLQGTATLAITGTATASGGSAFSPMVGSATLLFGQTGTLRGLTALGGTAALVLGQSGTLRGVAGAFGSVPLVLLATGTLAAAASVSQIEGATTFLLSTNGALGGLSAIAGASQITVVGAATLAGLTSLAGSSSSTLTGTAALRGMAAMAGSLGLSMGQTAGVRGVALAFGSTTLRLDGAGFVTQIRLISGVTSLKLAASSLLIIGVTEYEPELRTLILNAPLYAVAVDEPPILLPVLKVPTTFDLGDSEQVRTVIWK